MAEETPKPEAVEEAAEGAAKETAAAPKKQHSRRKAVDSWKSKIWYEIYAPKTFKEAFLGSIPSSNPDNIVGRIIEVLLYDLTGNFKHTNTKLRFKITSVVGEKCLTRFYGMELTRDYIRSVIHRGTSRVDGIFNFTTSDGFIYRISTFVITRRRAKRSQKKTIRKIMHQVIAEFSKNMPHDRFVRGIIFGKFAVNVAKIAKTIYPLKECQIRKIKVLKMPEGVEDQFFGEDDEQVDEMSLSLREHGKSLKAKKLKRKKEDEKKAAAAEGEEGAEPKEKPVEGEEAKKEAAEPEDEEEDDDETEEDEEEDEK